jgi:hypothetical protein
MINSRCEDCGLDAIRKGCAVLPCGRCVKSYMATQNGVTKVIETWQMIIPLEDNQGKPFRKDLIGRIRASVRDTFNGETYVRAGGSWKRGQRICADKSIRIEVDVYTEEHDKAEAYMASAKKVFRTILEQEKIYVTYSLSRFEFLLPEEFADDIGLIRPLPKKLDQIAVDLCRRLAAPCNQKSLDSHCQR